MLVKLLIPVVLGPVAAVLLAVGLTGDVEPSNFAAAVAAFYLLLAIGPWIALRPGRLWWVATPIAAIVGVPFAVGLALSLLGCHGANSGSTCVPQGPPLQLAFVFAAAVGIPGIGQALTLKAPHEKPLWVTGSFVGGAAMGAAWQIASLYLPAGLASNYLAAAIGGAVWAIVIAATLYAVARRRSIGRIPSGAASTS